MITTKDVYDILEDKIANETQKILIRNSFPSQIAEKMCDAIHGQEKIKSFQRLLLEDNEWLMNQQRQQEAVQVF